MTRATTRNLALAAGLLYLLTFAASLPTLALKEPVADHARFVLGVGSDAGVIWGSFLDLVCALAGIGTAVALYPIVRRHSRVSGIGFVATRTLEAATLFVGAIALMAIVTLRTDVAAGDTASLLTTSRALLAMHDWAFLFGPGFMAVCNAAFLATVMYRSRLVPRWIPTVGLIGAPLLLASSIATLFGLHDQTSSTAMLLVLPVAAWELSLGVSLTVKGVRTTSVEDGVVVAPALAA